jgi:hypothetical protein
VPEASRRTERLDAGLCAACGKRAHAPDKTRCEACAEAAAEAAKARREFAAKRNLCEACMQRKRVRGRGNRCAECADRYLPAQLKRDKRKRAARRQSKLPVHVDS